MVGERIESAKAAGTPLSEMAVLVRASFQTRAFEERLIALGVPYRVVGGARFYERAEIRDALAYLRVLAQPADDLAFERIVNVPKRGIGDSAIQAMHRAAREQGVPLSRAAAGLVETEALRPKPRAALRALLHGFERWRALNETDGHVVAAATLLDESGYTAMWQADPSPEAPGRLENLKELLRALGEYATLEGFLEHVALVMENDEAAAGERVTLMTLHAAKGLEFDVVFLPGWEEGLFPHQRALDEGGETSLEEERRLAYVGLTRARRRAIISHAANRRIYGNWSAAIPSRFLDELPEDAITREGALRPRVADTGFFGQFPMVARRPRVIEQGAWEVAPRPAQAAPIPVGARVFHQKFGYGTVMAVEQNRLDVRFDKAGDKRVLDGFVERA
jgi:DNA helicase-2/ATP-dependent DNA helicase PcrA